MTKLKYLDGTEVEGIQASSIPFREKGSIALDLGSEELHDQTTVCPTCSRTAIKQRLLHPNTFICRFCNKAFKEAESEEA